MSEVLAERVPVFFRADQFCAVHAGREIGDSSTRGCGSFFHFLKGAVVIRVGRLRFELVAEGVQSFFG